MIRYPNITGKNDAQKLDQMKSYLHQLADELNYQLDNTSKIGSGYPSSSVEAGAVAKPVKKDDAISNFNEIKGLIIKSADIVDAYSEEISKTLNGQYVAVSDFGTYKEETQAQITASSDRIDSVVEKQEEIDTELVDLERTLRSEIEQTAESIKLEVIGGEPGKTASIKLTVGDKSYSGEIDMTGLVTFFNLTDGKTEISGDNIKTGQILADLIKAGTIKSKDGEKIVIDLDNGKVHVVGTFETEWQVPTSGGTTTPVHSAMNPNGLFVQNGDGTDALRSAFSFYQAYVQNHNSDFTKAEAYMRPYGDPYEPGKSMMGLKHGDVAGVEHQVVETLLGTAFAQTEYKRGSRTLVMGASDARTFISGLDAPQYNTDAVNKAYVDGNFAPAGYGLGASLPIVDHADNADKPGFFYAKAGHPFDYGASHILVPAGTSDLMPTQIAFGINMNPTNYNAMAIRTKGGTWQAWEWINPPIKPGVEYRTIERFQGRPVFVQCVNLTGHLPVAGATKFIPHGIANVEYPIDWYGVYANSQAFVPNANFNGIMVTGSQVYVAPSSGSGIGGSESLYVVIKYLKTGI